MIQLLTISSMIPGLFSQLIICIHLFIITGTKKKFTNSKFTSSIKLQNTLTWKPVVTTPLSIHYVWWALLTLHKSSLTDTHVPFARIDQIPFQWSYKISDANHRPVQAHPLTFSRRPNSDFQRILIPNHVLSWANWTPHSSSPTHWYSATLEWTLGRECHKLTGWIEVNTNNLNVFTHKTRNLTRMEPPLL